MQRTKSAMHTSQALADTHTHTHITTHHTLLDRYIDLGNINRFVDIQRHAKIETLSVVLLTTTRYERNHNEHILIMICVNVARMH